MTSPIKRVNLPPRQEAPQPTYVFRMGNYKTGPQRELTDLTSRSLRFSLMEPNKHTLSMPGDVPVANYIQEWVTDINILRNGQPLGGPNRVTGTRDSGGTAGHQTIISTGDYRYLLDRRLLWTDVNTWTTTFGLQETMAWYFVNYTQGLLGGALGIVKGQWPSTGVSRKQAFPKQTSIMEAIDSLAQSDNGFNWDISYDQASNQKRMNIFYPQRGTDKGFVLDYDRNAGGIVSEWSRAIQDTEFANAVLQTGDTAVDNVALTAPDLSTRPEGRWDVVKSELTATTAEAVEATAIYNLAKASGVDPGAAVYALHFPTPYQPVYTFTLNPGAWKGPDQCWLGDIVSYRIASGRVQDSGQLRVYEIGIDVDSSNVETVTITLGRPRRTQTDNLVRAIQAIRFLLKRK